jgi:pimeloyl-ACP methyl ester carboxylesterase
MGLFVKPLRDAGFDCVAVDLPAHGASTGTRLNMPIGARAVLAVADALGPFAGVVTHSFGGPIAALAMEGGSPIGRQLSVARAVLIAAPHSLLQVTRNFGAGFGFSEALKARLAAEITQAAGREIATINTGDFLATAGKPCLIIHDEEDGDVAFSEMTAIADAAGPIATVMATKGLGHRRIVVMPNVVRASVRFLATGSPTP